MLKPMYSTLRRAVSRSSHSRALQRSRESPLVCQSNTCSYSSLSISISSSTTSSTIPLSAQSRSRSRIRSHTAKSTFHSSAPKCKKTKLNIDELPDNKPLLKTPKVSPNSAHDEVKELDTEITQTLGLKDHENSTRFNDQIKSDELLLAERLTEDGDIESALREFGYDASTVSPDEKAQLIQLVEELRSVTAKEKIVDGIVEGSDGDPDQLQAAVERSKHATEMMQPLSKAERKLLRSKGFNFEDEDQMEQKALEAFGGAHLNDGEDLKGLDESTRQLEKAMNDLDLRKAGSTFNPMGRGGYLDDAIESPSEPERSIPGYWNDDKSEDLGNDEVFNQDDLPAAGHLELDLHREIRQYARMMVWELPLLSKLAQPFNPPTNEQVLRFRYTTYMGDDHPAEKKVVVSFSPSNTSLNLSEIQRNKLIKLVGSRYNPDKDMIKMSCDTFETPAQNKRYLGDLVEVLLKEAKDSKDTFEDIPFDFRHHKPKRWHKFPESWIVTPERRAELLASVKTKSLPSPSPETTDESESIKAVKEPVHVTTPLDGLLYTPDGPAIRNAQSRLLSTLKSELATLANPRIRGLARDKIISGIADREKFEADLNLVDLRGRRPSKRPAKVDIPSKRALEEARSGQ